MRLVRSLRTAVGVALLAGASTAAAQEIVVTPSSPQGWAATGVNATSFTGITTQYARGTSPNDRGSLEIRGTDAEQGIRTRFASFVADPLTHSMGSLGSLQVFGFDWYRDGSSTVAANQAPAFRLHVRGTYAGQTGFGELIWERAYNNGGVADAPTDSWQTVTTDLDNGNFWLHIVGVGALNTTCSGLGFGTQTLNAWRTGCGAFTGIQIIGLSAGVGTIPAADGQTFRGAADNIRFQAGGLDFPVEYNFEPDAAVVPEPSTYVLMGSGLLGLAGVAARRRRQG